MYLILMEICILYIFISIIIMTCFNAINGTTKEQCEKCKKKQSNKNESMEVENNIVKGNPN
jgi:hypothetical protein